MQQATDSPGRIETMNQAPLIVHLIHRLDVGGLENGLINLINQMPPGRYRHAIVCLKDFSHFHQRIKVQGVEIIALNKREGKDWRHYVHLYRTLKRLQPALIHTRNLASLEGQLLALAAGIKLRVHSEHGRDANDVDGKNRKHRWLRQLLRPLVGHFIAVSRDLQRWLIDSIGVPAAQVTQINNGVDSLQFHPRLGPAATVGPAGFLCEQSFVIGSVGRMIDAKDFATLVRAFVLLAADGQCPGLRLMIIGEGPCRSQCQALLEEAGLASMAWLPGARDDIAQLMRSMDLFVLPSLTEGSSNTILEAMASGLPVIATAVGGNVDLVQPGCTGTLVAPLAPELLAQAISSYCRTPGLAQQHGARARRAVLSSYSLPAMAEGYLAVYDALMAGDN
jgi:sugar transferase (PEP-CTERM/EpsH1 system associated)